MDMTKIKSLLVLTLFSLIPCVVIGMILAGTRAVIPGNFSFQFTFYGLFGGLLYAVLKFFDRRNFIFVLILLIIFDFILLGGGNLNKLIIHGIYAIIFAGAIFFYVKRLESADKSTWFRNIFSFAGNTALAFLVIVMVLRLLPGYVFEISFLEGQTSIGLMIGLGMGLGFQGYFKIQDRLPGLTRI